MVLQVGLAVVVGIGIGLLLYELTQQRPSDHYQKTYQYTLRDTPRANNFTPKPSTAKPSSKRRRPKKEQEECIICFEPITYTNTKTLRCGHRYHPSCINKWFEAHQTRKCPYNCR